MTLDNLKPKEAIEKALGLEPFSRCELAAYLKEMVPHYLACALWASTDNSDESGGDPLDKNYSSEDFSPEALKKARLDCAVFLKSNRHNLKNVTANMAGYDFWLTRNGHGAGFWDRGLGEIGEQLTRACKTYGSLHVIVGDDGKLYLE